MRERERKREGGGGGWWCSIHRRSLRLPAPAIVGAHRTSQSTSCVLSGVFLPFTEKWRRGGKTGKRAVQHISQAECFMCPEYKKKKHTLKKSSREQGERKDLLYDLRGDCFLFIVPPNIREHWFLRNWSHIFPLHFFKRLSDERVLKSFLCCTISITPGGHRAPLFNICKLLTILSHASSFYIFHLIHCCFIQHNLYFGCVPLLSPGPALHPSLLLTPPPPP